MLRRMTGSNSLILEIVNLLTVGITSFNIKMQIPTDIPDHNQYIPAQNLESQKWLDTINEWTKNQQMLINGKMTKCLIFNFTQNYQFTTRLMLNDEIVEVLDRTRLLGTIITSDLKWDDNTANIVKKANARMQMLRKASSLISLKIVVNSYIESVH